MLSVLPEGRQPALALLRSVLVGPWLPGVSGLCSELRDGSGVLCRLARAPSGPGVATVLGRARPEPSELPVAETRFCRDPAQGRDAIRASHAACRVGGREKELGRARALVRVRVAAPQRTSAGGGAVWPLLPTCPAPGPCSEVARRFPVCTVV